MSGYKVKYEVVKTTSPAKRVFLFVLRALLLIVAILLAVIIGLPVFIVVALCYLLPRFLLRRLSGRHKTKSTPQEELNPDPPILPLLDLENLQLQYREVDATEEFDNTVYEGIICQQIFSAPEISGLHSCYFQKVNENHNGFLFLARCDFKTALSTTTLLSLNLSDYSINLIHQFPGFSVCTFEKLPNGNLRITVTEELLTTHLDIQF
jgi:hypothetical protein